MTRLPVSKSVRFEVFSRDGFTCQYCGGRAPDVVLQLDHVLAHSRGGPLRADNLATACMDCNAGKGARLLLVMPHALAMELAAASYLLSRVGLPHGPAFVG